MNEQSGSEPPLRSWLERLSHALTGEPRDRSQLIELLRNANQRKLLDFDALGMIEGVLQVAEMQVRDIMIPRAQMDVVRRDATLMDILPTLIESAHSRFPVIGEDRDEVVGILLAKDLLRYLAPDCDEPFMMQEVLRPPVFVPESKRLNVLLREFRNSRNHMAIVVDEYSGVAGLVTIEDVLEQIVGEIDDEHDIVDYLSQIMPHANGRYTVKALTPMDEFNAYFQTSYNEDEFDTIGGFVVNRFGHVPKRGEELEIDQFRVHILRADNRRVHLLEIRHRENPA
ncbi:HlyC/CorC family transporter [Thiorhodospira sibirica]|uniref:HlyC/CorC family transporter n=1 Tax=Thiorhodospira sibirica TaxID=154347 RepID=UPI00022C1717|nr:transporter associated domain-containing protein [Thiorhodospira sibirica]